MFVKFVVSVTHIEKDLLALARAASHLRNGEPEARPMEQNAASTSHLLTSIPVFLTRRISTHFVQF